MKFRDEQAQRLNKIIEEWKNAEEDIKLAEQVNKTIVIPSIKELRYGGRRLIQALEHILSDQDDSSKMGVIDGLLQDAWLSCHRARHDAMDAAVAQIAANIALAEQKLGLNSVLKAFPHFSELMHRVNVLHEKIASSRRTQESRERIYAELAQQDFPQLVELFGKFQASEGRIKAMAQWQRRRDAISVGGLIIGLISFAFSVFLYLK